MTIEGFDKTSAINTKGAFFSLQALLSSLAISTSVVFISSILVYKGFSGCSVYAANKAAFEATIRVLNVELANHGIRTKTIRP